MGGAWGGGRSGGWEGGGGGGCGIAFNPAWPMLAGWEANVK